MHMAIIILNHGSAQTHNDSMDPQYNNVPSVLPDELLSNDYDENIAHLLRLYPHAIQYGTMNEPILRTLMQLLAVDSQLYRLFLDIYLSFLVHETRIMAIRLTHDELHDAAYVFDHPDDKDVIKRKLWCFRPLLCTLFRLNWAKQTPGIMRRN